MRYSMSYEDHRGRIEVMEFDAASDAEAARAARHHMAVIRKIFRAEHPGARVRSGWYLLWIVINVDSGTTVYDRRASLKRKN